MPPPSIGEMRWRHPAEHFARRDAELAGTTGLTTNASSIGPVRLRCSLRFRPDLQGTHRQPSRPCAAQRPVIAGCRRSSDVWRPTRACRHHPIDAHDDRPARQAPSGRTRRPAATAPVSANILELLSAQASRCRAPAARAIGHTGIVSRATLAQSVGVLSGAIRRHRRRTVPPPLAESPDRSDHRRTLSCPRRHRRHRCRHCSTVAGRTPSPEQRYKQQEAVVGDITQNVSANEHAEPGHTGQRRHRVSGTVKKLLHVDFNDAGRPAGCWRTRRYRARRRCRARARASIASARARSTSHSSRARIRSPFAEEYVSRQGTRPTWCRQRRRQRPPRLARGQNDRDRANLGYSGDPLAVSGVVVDRQIDVGQTVAASFQTPVLF